MMLFRRDSHWCFGRWTCQSVHHWGSRHAAGDYWSWREIGWISRQVRLRGADRTSTESATTRVREPLPWTCWSEVTCVWLI